MRESRKEKAELPTLTGEGRDASESPHRILRPRRRLSRLLHLPQTGPVLPLQPFLLILSLSVLNFSIVDLFPVSRSHL